MHPHSRRALLLASAACALACASAPRATTAPTRPNVLLICVDDLRPELGSFGVEYVRSPHIDRLAEQGRAFTRHYVQAPTCGASRCALLTGRYATDRAGRGNGALVARARDLARAAPSLPEVFRDAGYRTVSVGKVSHHPGGRYGEGWDDPDAIEMPGAWDRHVMPVGPWGTPQGAMHGLAEGRARVRGATPALESFDGPDTSYPDGLVLERALSELDALSADGAPFFLAVGFIRPHLPFGAPARYLEPYAGVALPPIPHPQRPEGVTTWHGSGEFFGGYDHGGRDPRTDAAYADELRRHYAACVSYVDALIGRLLERVASLGLEDDTIVVLWGDHGWHLGEHGIWGKHSLFEESLRAPLVLRVPGLAQRGAASRAIVETIDLFPTLCALTGVAPPPGLHGRSLVPQLADPGAPGHAAVSYRVGAETLRTERHRLVRHVAGGALTHVELYDHEADAGETRNLAALEPERVRAVLEALDLRLARP